MQVSAKLLEVRFVALGLRDCVSSVCSLCAPTEVHNSEDTADQFARGLTFILLFN